MNTGKKKTRCACCNVKLPITAFPCRCGGFYCGVHRGDVDHKCTFDYRAENMKGLSTSLVKVVGTKVEVL